jgi:hypothetical protein
MGMAVILNYKERQVLKPSEGCVAKAGDSPHYIPRPMLTFRIDFIANKKTFLHIDNQSTTYYIK